MAQYKRPDNPQNSDLKPPRRRRLRGERFDWVPLIGLGLGLIVTVAAIWLAWIIFQRTLLPEPLVVAAPSPTVIVLTAPATSAPTPTNQPPTPTPIPTLTPQPTPDLSIAPEIVTVGFFARVANTSGIGVRVRGGPSTANVGLLVADEGLIVQVIGGPSEGSGFTWWQVALPDGTEGWVASDFLEPAGAPADAAPSEAAPAQAGATPEPAGDGP